MKKVNYFVLYFGIFLVLDGILSLVWGTGCLNSCFNNSWFGNIVRIVRALGGVVLILLSFKR